MTAGPWRKDRSSDGPDANDIIVKQHGGSKSTPPDEFTEIRVILPRTAAIPE